MSKKWIVLLVVFSMLFPLSGCWNYRGLNEMTIVSGIAIDKNPKSGDYRLSFEVVDLSMPVKTSGMNTKLVESEGKTIFDAARNAKKKITNKLYYGQTQIAVISKDIASGEDIGGVIDWFLRDNETRETLNVIISQEKTASEILMPDGIGQKVISSEIEKIIETDEKVTSSTVNVQLYQLYDLIHSEGKSLTLPAIHTIINDEERVCEVNGTAVFQGQRLVGFLTPEESKYFLFVTNQISGGILTFSSTGSGPKDSSLEIGENTSTVSYKYEDGVLIFMVKTDTTVDFDEYMGSQKDIDIQKIAKMEAYAEAELEKNITQVIQKVQKEFGSDIFGFGSKIYQKDVKLWNQLSSEWEKQFRSLKVEVHSKIHISNTSLLKLS